MNFSI